jgi:hypothetical protein
LIAEESCRVLMRQIHSRSTAPCAVTATRKDGTCLPLEIVVKATLTCNGRRLEILAVSQSTANLRTRVFGKSCLCSCPLLTRN